MKLLNYPLLDKGNRYPYHQYLKRFVDGCVGFHQLIYFQVLESWVKMTDDQLRSYLQTIRQKILEGLSFEHPDIHSKYQWLKDEYNELLIIEDNIKKDIYPPQGQSIGHGILYTHKNKEIHPDKE